MIKLLKKLNTENKPVKAGQKLLRTSLKSNRNHRCQCGQEEFDTR
jgi:hypothetical protein